MGYPERVVKIMVNHDEKTRLKVSRDEIKEISRWITFKCGFLQRG